MLAIEGTQQLLREARAFPLLSSVGLLLMLAAGGLDVLMHFASGAHAGHSGLAPEHAAHLLGVVGMVLVLAGVVVDGARRQLRHTAAKPGGLDPNAHR